MNRRQREAHRLTWLVLAPLLVVLVVGAMLFRRSYPISAAPTQTHGGAVRP